MASSDGLDPRFVDCRDRGHAWFDPDDKRIAALLADVKFVPEHRTYEFDSGATIRWLVCPRCTTQKKEPFNSKGVRLKDPSYRYPEGYLIKGQGRTGREQYRQAAVSAALRVIRKRRRARTAA